MGSDNSERLVKIHMRHLTILKEQYATLGVHAPPHILIEMRDIEQEIIKLGGTITPYKSSQAVKPSEQVAACPQCKAPIKLPPRHEDEKSPFIVYSVRVNTSIECGHCGTIIPNQFTEEKIPEVAKQVIDKEVGTLIPHQLTEEETPEAAKQAMDEEVKNIKISSNKKLPFAWFFKLFHSKR
jgi:hypothetical protein